MFTRRIDAAAEIKRDRQNHKQHEQNDKAPQSEPKTLALKPGQFSKPPDQAYRREENYERGRNPIESVVQLGREPLTMPDEFAAPKAGNRLRPELL